MPSTNVTTPTGVAPRNPATMSTAAGMAVRTTSQGIFRPMCTSDPDSVVRGCASFCALLPWRGESVADGAHERYFDGDFPLGGARIRRLVRRHTASVGRILGA